MKDSIELIAAIQSGEYDAALRQIREAARERENHLSISAGRQLMVGDRVVIKNIRPRYLIGAKATITRVMQTWVTLKLDAALGKFSEFAPLRVHMGCVEKEAS